MKVKYFIYACVICLVFTVLSWSRLSSGTSSGGGSSSHSGSGSSWNSNTGSGSFGSGGHK